MIRNSSRFYVLFKYLFLAAGIVCLFVLIRNIGWDRLTAELARIGWGFIFYMGIHAVEEAMKTIGWKISFPQYRQFSLWKLYLINWAGSAVTNIYQTGIVGSGTTKVIMIRDEASTQQGIASVMISTLSDALSLIIFISGGMFFVLVAPEIPRSLKIALILSFCLLSLSIIAFWALQRKGMPNWVISVLEKLPIPQSIKTNLKNKALELNDSVMYYHNTKATQFGMAVGIYLFRRFLHVVQVQLVLYLLGVPGGFRYSFLITVFSSLIDALFFFVPGRIGSHEGGRLLISKTLGMTTAQGLTIGVISRLNQIIWSLMGFGILVFWKELPFQKTHPPNGIRSESQNE